MDLIIFTCIHCSVN